MFSISVTHDFNFRLLLISDSLCLHFIHSFWILAYLRFQCYLQYISPRYSLYFLSSNIKLFSINVISISETIGIDSLTLRLYHVVVFLHPCIPDFVRIAILRPLFILGYFGLHPDGYPSSSTYPKLSCILRPSLAIPDFV
jgi:hypothetical protein